MGVASVVLGLGVGTLLSLIAYSFPYGGFYLNLPALGVAVLIENMGVRAVRTNMALAVTLINLVLYPAIFGICFLVVDRSVHSE
jgi:hypothetical protein